MRTEKTMEHESDDDINCNWYSPPTIGIGIGGIGNKRTSGYHSNYSIIENGQNTEESPGDLRRLTVTQTPVKKPSANHIYQPSARAGYETRSIFKQILTGLNSEFSFS